MRKEMTAREREIEKRVQQMLRSVESSENRILQRVAQEAIRGSSRRFRRRSSILICPCQSSRNRSS